MIQFVMVWYGMTFKVSGITEGSCFIIIGLGLMQRNSRSLGVGQNYEITIAGFG